MANLGFKIFDTIGLLLYMYVTDWYVISYEKWAFIFIIYQICLYLIAKV